MIKNKLFRNSNIIFTSLLLFASLMATGFTFLYYTKKNDYNFEIISSLDQAFWGDMEISNQENPEHFLSKPGNEEKDISKLESYSKRWYLPSFVHEEKIKTYFENPLSKETVFTLKKNVNPKETYLRIVHNREENKLDFIIPSYEYQLNNETIKTKEYTFFTSSPIDSEAVIKISKDNFINLKKYQNDRYILLKKILNNPEIIEYKNAEKNFIETEQGSFENGFWSDNIMDCSNTMEGKPEIGMKISNDSTEGENSIKLSSSNHYACTMKRFDFSPDKNLENIYAFSFDYKSLEGGEILYYIKLETNETKEDVEDGKTVFKRKGKSTSEFLQSKNKWQNFETFIKPKDQNIETILVSLYAPSDGSKKIVNLYDNVKFEEYKPSNKLEIEQVKNNIEEVVLLENIKLKKGLQELLYRGDTQNLLEDYNPDFENGLWKTEVGDCSNYLPGDPEISMSIEDEDKSLRIESENHFACTNRIFPIRIRDDLKYELNFDYKNLEGGEVDYYISFIGLEKTEIMLDDGKFIESYITEGETENINVENHDWNTFEKEIKPKIENVQAIKFFFYAKSEGDKKVVNLYDNLELKELIPRDSEFYFFETENENIQKPQTTIKTFNINKYKDKIEIDYTYNNAGKNDYLLLYLPNKNYSNSLKLDGIDQKNHYRINDYENLWLIDIEQICNQKNLCEKDGQKYVIRLVLKNNNIVYFQVFMIVSILANLLFSFIILFIIFKIKKKKM